MGQGSDTAEVRLTKPRLLTHLGCISFRPEFRQDAEKKLSIIRSGDASGKELLFVGLHVRRGDYVEFGKQVFQNEKKGFINKTRYSSGLGC